MTVTDRLHENVCADTVNQSDAIWFDFVALCMLRQDSQGEEHSSPPRAARGLVRHDLL